MKNFDISLYVATAYKEASANTFKNIPEESYKTLFRSVSNQLSDKKLNRYSSADILYLNHKSRELYDRECRVCKRLGKVNEDDLCSFCSSIKKLSNSILYNDFFVVVDKYEENAVPLPNDNYLLGENEGDLRERMKNNNYIRVYSINKPCTGNNIANVLWLANNDKDNTRNQTFEELAKASEGIKRIAVLRADVDNLGQAFVQGFSEKYNTLSRTATLSRQLSIFFTKYLKEILDEDYSFSLKKKTKKRNAKVVYSGGDDVFIVGAWNEVIELAVDIKNSFEKYTENTLTFSAGIGLYSSSYPISRIAYEVGSLEDKSKKLPNKNAITLFDDGCSHKEQDITILDGTYHWEEFVNEVVREKFATLDKFFSLQNKKDQDTERGNAFLYKILELIRGREEKIHFVRLVYLLSRLEPKYDSKDKENSLKKIQAYKEFSSKVLKWYDNERDSRQLKTAINMFAYYNRDSDRKENE
ncbi:MAG: type III-A CRISPR-associated protein Cas10/Csm1 [Ruminococcaceae bacterium]|nr:type III-A CRISPR-associated protein Cas10/Csm1 [Oscillospiraceae bacterium]